ncbi:MAG: PHP domain-containing protein [Acidobacteria bacterium]|nr:PHP domain-containing protein [Acidobacteriota bacterium]
MFVDLHIHSRYSTDGELEPAHLVRLASEHGLGALAVSDHDTVDGIPEAERAAAGMGIRLIPSAELSVISGRQELHLLVPFVDPHAPGLTAILKKIVRFREGRARARLDKLRQLGFHVTFEEVERASGGSALTGAAIARSVLRKYADDVRLQDYLQGPKSDRPEVRFYGDFFQPGCPAHVEMPSVDIREAIECVLECGAVPVLAHPGAPHTDMGEDLLRRLKDAGLQGLEVYSSYHSEDQTAQFASWARELDLVASAGSDFHGSIKPHVPFGAVKRRGLDLLEELDGRRPKRRW